MSSVQLPESAPASSRNADREVLPRPDLTFTPEVAAETAHLYERVKHIVPSVEWPFHAPYVAAINRIKKQRNAVILAHNYQTPEIYNCVADVVGDSLQLAKMAAKLDARIIVQGGVHFMAETSKLLSPEKMVLIPDLKAGCSLASLLDHGRGYPPPARGLSRRAGGGLREHIRRSEGRGRYLLHVRQCGSGGGEPRDEPRALRARPVSCEIRAIEDECEDHRLAWRLRGP